MSAPVGRASGDARLVLLCASTACLVLLVVLCGLERPAFGAATVWPAWLWAAPFILIMLPAFGRRHRRTAALLAFAWVAFLAWSCEETAWPLRALRRWPAVGFEGERMAGAGLRVATVNCCGGEVASAVEVRRFDPDVVLLQEAPGPAEMPGLARELFGAEGSWVCVGDNAALARGQCAVVRQEPRQVYPYLWCRVWLASGPELEAVSVHLVPPQLRTDLWRPSAWASTADLERGRGEQLQRLLSMLARVPPSVPLVLGGDWNAPATDGMLRPMRRHLRDTFRVSGVGWGNTVLNELPISRFDQVWCSPQFVPRGTVAVRSSTSDHRMVIADLALRPIR